MARNWQTISERNFDKGMNQRDSENLIPEGYVEFLKNIDTTKTATLSKRVGYQLHGGQLPLKGTFTKSGPTLTVTVDAPITVPDGQRIHLRYFIDYFSDSAPGPDVGILSGTTSNVSGNTFQFDASSIVTWDPSFDENEANAQCFIWGLWWGDIYDEEPLKAHGVQGLTTFRNEVMEELTSISEGSLYGLKFSNPVETYNEYYRSAYLDSLPTFREGTVGVGSVSASSDYLYGDGRYKFGPLFTSPNDLKLRNAQLGGGSVGPDFNGIAGMSVVLEGTNAGGWKSVKSIVWTARDQMRVTLSVPSLSAISIFWNEVDSGYSLGDFSRIVNKGRLDLQDTRHEANEGSFLIVGVSSEIVTLGELYIDVRNDYYADPLWDGVNFGLHDEVDSSAYCGIFSTVNERLGNSPLGTGISGFPISRELGYVSVEGSPSNPGFWKTPVWTAATSLSLNYFRTTAQFSVSGIANTEFSHPVVGDVVRIGNYQRHFKVVAEDASIITLDEAIEVINGDSLRVMGRWIPIESPNLSFPLNTPFPTNATELAAPISVTSGSGNLYLSNGVDEAVKYDGQVTYRAGLPRLQPYFSLHAEDLLTTGTGIPDPATVVSYAPVTAPFGEEESQLPSSGRTIPDWNTANSEIEISEITLVGSQADLSAFILNQPIRFRIDFQMQDGSQIYTQPFPVDETRIISAIEEKQLLLWDGLTQQTTSTTCTTFTLNSPILLNLIENPLPLPPGQDVTDLPSTAQIVYSTPSIWPGNTWNYYFRYQAEYTKDNKNITATVGLAEAELQAAGPFRTKIRTILPPDFEGYDYSNLSLHIYRTLAGGGGDYREVAKYGVEQERGGSRYLYRTLIDSFPDTLLPSQPNDNEVVNIAGTNTLNFLHQPPIAKFLTSLNNRVIAGNVTNYPLLNLALLDQNPLFDAASLDGLTLSIRPELASTDVTNFTFGGGISYPAIEITDALSPISGDAAVRVRVAGTVTPAIGSLIYLESPSFSGWYPLTTTQPVSSDTWWFFEVGTDLGIVSEEGTATVGDSSTFHIPIGEDASYGDVLGNNLLSLVTLLRRLANAINAWSRIRENPYILATAGVTYSSDEILLEQPILNGQLATVEVSGLPSNFRLFVNGVQLEEGTEAEALFQSFPSRLMASFERYPELFNDVYTTEPQRNNSIIEVNPADGQEITAITTLFGTSAFGNASTSDALVVFKTDSIYLVDFGKYTAFGESGAKVIKIESQEQGCSFPNSVATTKDGIIFANYSGIYKLDKGLNVIFVGSAIERFWDERVPTLDPNSFVGFNDKINRQYRLHFPDAGGTLPSNALTYDHNKEYKEGIGAWGLQTNIPSLCWESFDANTFFGSTNGKVYKRRNAGDSTDFRDDDAPIEAEILLRPLHFGDSSVRKYLNSIALHLRGFSVESGTKLFVATDLSNNFQELDQFKIDVRAPLSGIGDTGQQKVVSLRFSTRNSKFVYLHNKLTNASLDEGLELTMVEYRLTGLKETGTTEAARTLK